MFLIVGLGNPGKEYEMTRHNIGFLVIDAIAQQQNLTLTKKTSFEAILTDGTIGSERAILCKPQTFMNKSGRSVKKILDKNQIDKNEILIVHDDADLPFGDVRFKEGGGSAGHNGVQSVLDVFPRGTNIKRVRVGIGRPNHPDIPLEDFVLQKWSKQETDKLDTLIDPAIELVTEFISK